MEQSGKQQLRVLVIDGIPGRASMVEQALTQAGYRVIGLIKKEDNLLRRVEEMQPDVIIIDLESPDRDTLESMRLINNALPRPVVMFAEDDDSRTIHAAVRAGVSAYVVDGLSAQRLKPILDVAIARFHEFQSLRHELEETRTKLADRKDVEKAKGILMRRGMNEEEAYRSLRRLAMDRNMRIGEAARSLIAAADLLG